MRARDSSVTVPALTFISHRESLLWTALCGVLPANTACLEGELCYTRRK